MAIGFMIARILEVCGKSFILDDFETIKICGAGYNSFKNVSFSKYCSSSMMSTAAVSDFFACVT